jgi:dihydroxy-acid dehydratase
MTEAELNELGHACAPTLGSCPGQFTANTMAMVAETLGLALPGSAMLPAAYLERLALGPPRGRRAARDRRDGGPLPRDLVTRKSLENAAAAVAATGGSTNAGLTCRRSRTRPASASRSTTSPRCSRARR